MIIVVSWDHGSISMRVPHVLRENQWRGGRELYTVEAPKIKLERHL
jgi:hypothetical protein